MPAVVRGGRRQTTKSAGGRAPRQGAKPRGRAPARPAGKLDLVGRVPIPNALLWGGAGLCAVALLAVGALGGWGEALARGVGGGLDRQLAAMGVRLERVHIQGATPAGQAAIRRALDLRAGQPLAGLDLEAVRASVEQVGWVQEARVVRLLPDTLIIAVTERRPLAVWQSGGRAAVIDGRGQVIEGADPGRFAELPLVVGQGADAAAADLLPLIEAWPRLKARVEAVVRVDDRRWDLRLKDGGLIQLPAVDESAALVQLELLDQRERLLELGFARVDLRVPGTVAVRPRGSV